MSSKQEKKTYRILNRGFSLFWGWFYIFCLFFCEFCVGFYCEKGNPVVDLSVCNMHLLVVGVCRVCSASLDERSEVLVNC